MGFHGRRLRTLKFRRTRTSIYIDTIPVNPLPLSTLSMKTSPIGLSISVLILAVLATSARAENKVLFLGNSFTLGSGGASSVPNIFDALARAAGQADPSTVMVGVGGKNYQYHYENHQTEISSQPWTHVVIQNYSTEPTHIGSPGDHMTYGKLLYSSIMANNGETNVHLYQTWARSAIHSLITGTSTSSTFESTKEMLDELATNYQALANALNSENPSNPPVKVNPVGQAWNDAGGNLHPNDSSYIDLFSSDEYHGNSLGYYLSACVHYAAIYEDSPVGLYSSPEITSLGLKLNINDARFIENIAWQSVVTAGLAEDRPDITPPTWTSLIQKKPNILILQFDDSMDETSALDPTNYAIINRGRRVFIENVELAGLNSSVLLTTSIDLIGNILVDVSNNLLDESGNGLEGTTRTSLRVDQSSSTYIYIDFAGASTVSSASNRWNQVTMRSEVRDNVGNGTGTPAELVSDLVNGSGTPTGISLALVDAPSGTNQSGTTSGPYPIGATSDSLYGQDGAFGGYTDNGQAIFRFSNLDPSITYDFTFYASRTGSEVTDNRQTTYTATGTTSNAATLNAAQNTSTTVEIREVQPTTHGDITLTVYKGLHNTNSNGFYYIGAVVIDCRAGGTVPKLYRPVSLGSDIIIDWTGSGRLWMSENLINWTPVTPQPMPPYIDTTSGGKYRFYRIEY